MEHVVRNSEGWTIKVRTNSFTGCCGGMVVSGYGIENPEAIKAAQASGSYDVFGDGTYYGKAFPTAEEIKDMHQALYARIRRDTSGSVIMVAMDPVMVEEYGWDSGTNGGNFIEGVASLEQFCVDNEFDCSAYAKGPRDRRLGVFSKGPYSVDGDVNEIDSQLRCPRKFKYSRS